MGNLIRVLSRDIDGSAGNFFLDFESKMHSHARTRARTVFDVCAPTDAQPTEAESMVWVQVNEVLTEAQVILAELQAYRGAGEEIRQVTRRTRHTHNIAIKTRQSAGSDPATLRRPSVHLAPPGWKVLLGEHGKGRSKKTKHGYDPKDGFLLLLFFLLFFFFQQK